MVSAKGSKMVWIPDDAWGAQAYGYSMPQDMQYAMTMAQKGKGMDKGYGKGMDKGYGKGMDKGYGKGYDDWGKGGGKGYDDWGKGGGKDWGMDMGYKGGKSSYDDWGKGGGKGYGMDMGYKGGYKADMGMDMSFKGYGKGYKGDFKGDFKGDYKGDYKGKGKKGKDSHTKKHLADGNRWQLEGAWKTQLMSAVGKALKISPTKDSIKYETEGEDGVGYKCTVTFEKIENSYDSAEGLPSRKAAEDNAAMQAVKAEFPEAYAAALKMQQKKQVESNPKAFKSAGKVVDQANSSWKARLHCEVGKEYKPLTKTTLVYTTTEEGAGFVSELSSDKFEAVYISESAQASQKLAEEDAAMVALKAMFPKVYNLVPKACRNIAAGGAVAAWRSSQAGGGDPKSRLRDGMAIIIDRALAKGDIVFSVEEDIGDMSFTALVTLNCIDSEQTFSGESSSNRKEAENNAALAALESYTDLIEEKKPAQAARKSAGGPADEPKKKKAKIDGAKEPQTGGPQDAKSRLQNGISIVAGRTITKGDIDYNVESEGGNSIASVTLNCLEGKQTFTGEAVKGKTKDNMKQAEQACAEVALVALQGMIDEARPAHEERKKEKQAANEAKRKEKKEAEGLKEEKNE